MPVVARIEVPPPEPFCECDEGAEAVGTGYRFIAPSVATEPLVMEAADGSVFLWTPTELCYRDEQGQIDFIAGSAPVQLEVRGREARYRRTFPSSDEVHVAQPEGRKYWLVLHERPRDPASYLQGEIWFGVSGMVGGIPLPPGIHRTMESFGFQFKAPFAADLMDASTECWYEVVDTEDGQMLFIWCLAEWLLRPERVYPVKLDPTVGTSTFSAATGYANGRHIDRFDDGTLVAVYRAGASAVLRYSRDGGQTWLAPTVGDTVGAYLRTSIRVRGGYVWFVGANSGHVDFMRATPNESYTEFTWTSPTRVGTDTEGSEYGYPDLEVRESGTDWIVPVVWSLVSSTPSNAATCRRVTVTASGSVTVASWWTTSWYGVSASTVPCLTRDDAGNILCAWKTGRTGAGYGVLARMLPADSLAWGSVETVTASYDPNGAHLTCAAAPDGSRHYVGFRTTSNMRFFARTPDGTWTQLPALPVVGHISALADKDGNLWCAYTSSGLHLQKYDPILGQWEAPQTLDNDVTASFPAMRPNATGDTVDLIYTVGSGSPYEVRSAHVKLNRPPLAPSNLTRTPFDAADDATFAWQHNDDPGDGQAQYHLQIILDGAVVYDTGEVQSPVSQHVLPGGTLQNGKTYQWRVRTADQSGEWSPWSDYAVFQTGPKPVATILSPSTGATVSTSEVTVEWSVPSQSSATVRLYDEAGQTVLQEHEVTTPSARQRTITGLENNQSYQVSVQPVSAIGVVGDEVFSGPFSVQYTPPPKPEVTAAGQHGFIRVTITNPAPTDDEPEVTHNDIYRREPGRDWVRIATGIAPDGTYDDYAVGSGVVYEYRARAVGDNGTYTDSQLVQAATAWEGWRFTPAGDPTREVRFLSDWAARRSLDEDRQEVVTRGRYPITFRGPSRPARLDLTAVFDDDGELTAGEWARRIYALSGVLGYLRSPDGDIWYGELYAPNDDWQRDLVANGRVVRVQFVEKGPVPVAV